MGTPSATYFIAASKIDIAVLAPGKCSVELPSTPGVSRFFRRTLANVPRIITSWLPRREP